MQQQFIGVQGGSAESRPDPLAIQRLAQAVQELDRIEPRARPEELAFSRLAVARCYADLGMHDTAEWYYRQALASLRHRARAALAVEALSGLAEALTRRAVCSVEPADRHVCLEQARDLAFEAAGLASQALAEADRGSALYRLVAVLESCGDTADAQVLRQRATPRHLAEDRIAA